MMILFCTALGRQATAMSNAKPSSDLPPDTHIHAARRSRRNTVEAVATNYRYRRSKRSPGIKTGTQLRQNPGRVGDMPLHITLERFDDPFADLRDLGDRSALLFARSEERMG